MKMLSKKQQLKRLPNRMEALHKVTKVVNSCETYIQTLLAKRMIRLYRKQYQINHLDPRDRIIDAHLDALRDKCNRISQRWFEDQK